MIAREVGIPVQLEQATRDKKYGYYPQILVDDDLPGSLIDFITVEHPNYGFDVEIRYEKLADSM